jgi:hypothetical protein
MFTADSRKNEASAVSAVGGENEDKYTILTDFSPGNQTENISYLNAPVYSANVAANATTAFAAATYSFSIHADSSTNIGTPGAASHAFARFQSYSYFHLDQGSTVEIFGTFTASSVDDTNGLGTSNDLILHIADANYNTDRFFGHFLRSSRFDITRSLAPGDYFFRLETTTETSSTGTGSGTSRAVTDVVGTFTLPEPTELLFVAGLLRLLRRRRQSFPSAAIGRNV